MASPIKRNDQDTEKGGTFRLLMGSHLDNGPKGCECRGCLATGGKSHVYESYGTYYQSMKHSGKEPVEREQYDNDLVESDKDLEHRFNQYVGGQCVSQKFVREGTQYGAAPQPFPVDKMTYPQLLAYATELGIEVKDNTKKDELIKAIKSAGELVGTK